jgi:phospholipid-transporting ATPase
MSNIMLMMNSLLYSVFVFQIILCFVFSVLFVVWQKNNIGFLPYLSLYSESFEIIEDAVDTGDLFVKILTFSVAYSHLIPISLYVALEIVKLIQSMLIFYDAKMIDPNTGNAAQARTSDLIEEMGQVEFIFSDKTGTLTKNEMEFRKCFINNNVYGESAYPDKKAKFTINGDSRAFNILTSSNTNEYLKDKILIEEFFTALAVCHSAFVEEKDNIKNFQVILINLIIFIIK